MIIKSFTSVFLTPLDFMQIRTGQEFFVVARRNDMIKYKINKINREKVETSKTSGWDRRLRTKKKINKMHNELHYHFFRYEDTYICTRIHKRVIFRTLSAV